MSGWENQRGRQGKILSVFELIGDGSELSKKVSKHRMRSSSSEEVEKDLAISDVCRTLRVGIIKQDDKKIVFIFRVYGLLYS